MANDYIQHIVPDITMYHGNNSKTLEGGPALGCPSRFNLNQISKKEAPIILEKCDLLSADEKLMLTRWITTGNLVHRFLLSDVIWRVIKGLSAIEWKIKVIRAAELSPLLLSELKKANIDTSLVNDEVAAIRAGVISHWHVLETLLCILEYLQEGSYPDVNVTFTPAQMIVLLRKHLKLADTESFDIDWKYLHSLAYDFTSI